MNSTEIEICSFLSSKPSILENWKWSFPCNFSNPIPQWTQLKQKPVLTHVFCFVLWTLSRTQRPLFHTTTIATSSRSGASIRMEFPEFLQIPRILKQGVISKPELTRVMTQKTGPMHSQRPKIRVAIRLWAIKHSEPTMHGRDCAVKFCDAYHGTAPKR